MPPLWVFCLSAYFTYDASCAMLNNDWTPLTVGIVSWCHCYSGCWITSLSFG